ncbi:MAG: carboxypeptidase regulatory-like domain-containing protein [Bacteroidales bacterium]|nr:carboxypeptidase regulatory-like domain-containing protein [Bacteroidales bacterium]
MKKKNLLLSVALFFSILPLALFSGCDKDTNCYLDVEVVGEATVNPNSGTVVSGAPVEGAVVEIYQDGGSVYNSGITGGDGVYSTYFTAPAIVKIKAAYPLPTGGQLRGETSVRLREGETLSARITLSSQVYF